MDKVKKTDNSEKQAKLRDKYAQGFDDWYVRVMGKYHWFAEKKTIRRMLELRKDDTIIDLGCGTGRFTIEELAQDIKKICAIDFSKKSIQILQEKIKKEDITNVQTLVWDIRNPLPIEKNSFDKLVSIQVIQHLSDKEKEAAMKNSYNVLKPNGIAVITVYNWSSVWNYWYYLRTGQKLLKEGFWADGSLYYSRSTPAEMRRIFLKAGFRDVKIRGCINLPLYRRLNTKSLALFDMFVSRFTISNLLGTFLVCKGKK